MKLLFSTLILAATASVFGQDASPAPALPALPALPAMPARAAIMPATDAYVIAAGVTKNAPFSADESGETVRVMPDGNRIVENWTGKIARNSQGHIHRNVNGGKVGSGVARPYIISGGAAAPSVIALGSGDGKDVMVTKIEAETAASRAIMAPADGTGVTVVTSGNGEPKRAVLTKIEAAEDVDKMAIELRAIAVAGLKHAEDGKRQTRKESLGTRDFGGVQAEGHRVITTYAPGAVGNERELEVTSEVWLSKDLGVVVYSKRSDPRTGETTYQMTNIVRAEPDASLFPNK